MNSLNTARLAHNCRHGGFHMNPFNEKPCKIEKCFDDWKKLYPTAYDKHATDAYTKVRTILLNGTEFEQNWFMHQLCRHTTDNNLRRDVALLRKLEQQQQKRLSYFKPKDETILEKIGRAHV